MLHAIPNGGWAINKSSFYPRLESDIVSVVAKAVEFKADKAPDSDSYVDTIGDSETTVMMNSAQLADGFGVDPKDNVSNSEEFIDVALTENPFFMPCKNRKRLIELDQNPGCIMNAGAPTHVRSLVQFPGEKNSESENRIDKLGGDGEPMEAETLSGRRTLTADAQENLDGRKTPQPPNKIPQPQKFESMNNDKFISRIEPLSSFPPGGELQSEEIGDETELPEAWTPEGTCNHHDDSGEWSLWPDNASREPFVGNPRIGPVENIDAVREPPGTPAMSPRVVDGSDILREPDLGVIGRPSHVKFPVGHAIATKAQEDALDRILAAPVTKKRSVMDGPPPRVKVTGNRCPWGIDITPNQRALEAAHAQTHTAERLRVRAARDAVIEAEEAARPSPYNDHWQHRFAALVNAVGERWGWKISRNLEYQGGLIYRLVRASGRLKPSSWDACVNLMLAKAEAPSGVADYLGAICEKRAGLDELAGRNDANHRSRVNILGDREEDRKSWAARLKMFADMVSGAKE